MPEIVDVSHITMKSDGMSRDSMAVALQAVAHLMGRDATVEEIAGWIGSPFAPAVNHGEDCASWWRCQAKQSVPGLNAACEGLGLSSRRIDLPERTEGSSPEDEAVHQRCASILEARMQEGAVLLADGG
jgi:hypothetical protein